MPAQIEARSLSGVDLGKTVEGTDINGRKFAGALHRVEQRWGIVVLQVDNERAEFTEFRKIAPSDALTITGKES